MLVRFAKSVSSSAVYRRSSCVLASGSVPGRSGAPLSPSNANKGFLSEGISPPEHTRSIVGPPRRHLHSPGPVSTRFRDDSDRISVASTLSEAEGQRLRVAVDVDEVLGRFVYALNLFCKDRYGMDYAVEDYWIYEFAKIWNCSPERSNEIVHEFFKSPHFREGIPVIPGAFEALARMGSSHDLVVVTSRQHVIQDATLEWIDRHYPGLFQEVYFGNHFALEGVSRKKSDICRSIGASILIDDNPGYAVECAEAGINVLLYDWNEKYPWSKLASSRAHPLIKIVRDWQEVEKSVLALASLQVRR